MSHIGSGGQPDGEGFNAFTVRYEVADSVTLAALRQAVVDAGVLPARGRTPGKHVTVFDANELSAYEGYDVYDPDLDRIRQAAQAIANLLATRPVLGVGVRQGDPVILVGGGKKQALALPLEGKELTQTREDVLDIVETHFGQRKRKRTYSPHLTLGNIAVASFTGEALVNPSTLLPDGVKLPASLTLINPTVWARTINRPSHQI